MLFWYLIVQFVKQMLMPDPFENLSHSLSSRTISLTGWFLYESILLWDGDYVTGTVGLVF